MDVDDSAAATATAGTAAANGGGNNTALMEILMDDDELDAMAELAEAPVAAQISHSQIIEKQAHSIAKLEKQIARAKEYKELTKVKLKEAALRLREYRLKVEALMGDVEQLKKAQQASETTLKKLQKQNGDSSGEQAPDREIEEPVAAGRGKGGRGRGRGRGGGRGRGRGAAAAASSEVISVEEKPAVETNSVGTQAEFIQKIVDPQVMATQSDMASGKSFSDAATQTEMAIEKPVVETVETGVQTQSVETVKKCVDSGSQTTISGEIRAVSAAAVSVGLQTETPSVAELGCQCDLLPEQNSADRIFNDIFSQQSADISAALSSTSVAAVVEETKANVSRKRKRSFESTGRGEQPPKPSVLLAKQNQLASKNGGGDNAMVHTTRADADMEAGDSVNCTIEETERDSAAAMRTAKATETNREIVEEKAALEPKQPQPEVKVSSESTIAVVNAPTDQVSARSSERRVDNVYQVESSPSRRIPDGEIPNDALLLVAQDHTEPPAASHIDAISAEIDAELEFSDSDDEDMESDLSGVAESQQQKHSELADPQPERRPVALDEAVCNEVDKELDFDSSENEEDKTEEAGSKPAGLLGDAVSAAIDDELASSDEEEEMKLISPSKTPARPSTGSVSKDLISAAIDDELTSSSDDNDEETSGLRGSTIPVTDAAVAAAIDDELASISEDDDEKKHKYPTPAAQVNGATLAAAIDGDLASSSDKEPDEKIRAQPPPSTLSIIKGPISAAIDDELATSSDEEDVADGAVQSAATDALMKNDPIGAAIDEELASSSDEDNQEERVIVQPTAKAVTVKSDPIAGVIDDELASSSDEEDGVDQPIRLDDAPFAVNNDPVAKAIDDELASSSDEEADRPAHESVSVAVSAVHDPIGAAIDDELASSLDDEELDNHTDKPSPPSTSGVNDVIGVAIKLTRSIDDVTNSNDQGHQFADENNAETGNAHTEETVTPPESSSVEKSKSSSSTEKDLVGAAINDELASSLDEEDSEKHAPSPSNTVAATAVSDQGGSAEVKFAVSDVDKNEDSKSLLKATPPSTPGSLLPSQKAVAAIEVPIRSQIKSGFSGARSPLVDPSQSVVGAQTSLDTNLNEKSGDFQIGASSTTFGDGVKANCASMLSLSSSSDSDGSDSSDSSSDSDDDHGMDYESEEVEREVLIEKKTFSSSRKKPTGAPDLQSVAGDPQEEHNLTNPAGSSDRDVPKRSGGCETSGKLPFPQPSVIMNESKSDTTIASAQLHPETRAAANGQDDNRDQSPLKKRPRTESFAAVDSAEHHDTYHDTSSSTGGSSSKKSKQLHADDSLLQHTDAISKSEKMEANESFNAKVTADKEVSSTGPQHVQPKPKPKDPHAKHLAAFRHDIVRKDTENEKTHDVFVSRTLTVLTRYCAKHGAGQPILVTKFCGFLAADYRNKNVSPMEMVKGTCAFLRSPRVRHLIENHAFGVCFLAYRVLMGLVGASNQGDNNDVLVVAEAKKYLVAECLDYLRSLLLGDRDAVSASTSDVFSQLQLTRAHKNAVSHDKEFLAHVCSFYTRVCKSSGFGESVSVVLFDLLRRNPNIKGLYFTCFVVEVAPELLQIEYDKRGRAQEVLLRNTIHHVLPVVAIQSARRQELLLEQSSQNILHQIAKYVHADSLVQVDAEDPVFQDAFAAKVWNDYILPLSESKAAPDEKDRIFEVCKSLELLAAAYEYRQMMELFPVERFQDAFAASAHSEGGAALIRMVGAIAVVFAEAITSNVSKARNSIANDRPGSTCADYVLRVCDWLQKLLMQKGSTSENTVEVQVASAAVCVELITEAAATRERRDEMLRDVLKWFRSQSHEQQMRFPGSFLRQLRLVTVSSRPVLSVVGG